MKYVVIGLIVGLAFLAYMTAYDEVQPKAFPTQEQHNYAICLDYSRLCRINTGQANAIPRY